MILPHGNGIIKYQYVQPGIVGYRFNNSPEPAPVPVLVPEEETSKESVFVRERSFETVKVPEGVYADQVAQMLMSVAAIAIVAGAGGFVGTRYETVYR